MPHNNLGPPEKERPGGLPSRQGQTEELETNTNSHQISAPARQCGADTWRASLRRRRDASLRLPPLDCGCRDPWPCRCTEPPLSEKMIDAGRDAALHILAAGQTPLLEIEILRALYRRGGSDRRLAEQLHALAGVVA